MTNKNNDISTKAMNTAEAVLAGSLVAVKTMGFAYICMMIAKKSNPIIGTICLIGLEVVYHKAGRTFADAVHKKGEML